MGKRTASEANVDGTDDHPIRTSTTSAGVATESESNDRNTLMESPVPLAWQHTTSHHLHTNVEPAGACHTRVRVRSVMPKQLQQPQDAAMEEDTMVAQLPLPLPPLIAPLPRRVVSPELIFQQGNDSAALDVASSFADLTRRRFFRPIGGLDRSDVEITSPPSRATNPVVLDARFKSMQRLDPLSLATANAAPLQPFHRPTAHRRLVAKPAMQMMPNAA